MFESQIYSLLDIAVFQRLEAGRFKPAGELPEWWTKFAKESSSEEISFQGMDPFLDNFLIDAEKVWTGRAGKRESSGIWQYESADGRELLLEAFAITSNVHNVLAFREYSRNDQQHTIQQGRGIKLEKLRDEARRNQLQIELQAARVSSDQLARTKAEFLATISHEMRTPLTSIMGLIEMLKDSPLNGEQYSQLDQLHSNTDSMLALVQNLLSVARLESGKTNIQPGQLSLVEMSQDLAVSFAGAAMERGLEFGIITEDMPSTIETDRTLLRQVLNNLIDNAIRFTDTGSVKVIIKPSSKGDRVEFTVKDTGIGIPPEKHDQVLELFQQADTAFTRRHEGIGLGLTIAHRFVRHLGGSLQFESTHGKGSEFRFALPASWNSSKTDEPKTPPPTVAENLRVLIAEDNRINRQFLVHILQKHKHFVHCVENGEEALDYLEENEVDVVLMDCQMPVMSGYEASAEIRRREKTTSAYLPIIAVTANAMPGNEVRCRESGMDFFISKPFQTKHLLSLVQEAARRKIPSLYESSSIQK